MAFAVNATLLWPRYQKSGWSGKSSMCSWLERASGAGKEGDARARAEAECDSLRRQLGVGGPITVCSGAV